MKGQEGNLIPLQQLVVALCFRNGLTVSLDESGENGKFLVLELPTGQVSFRLTLKQRRELEWIECRTNWDGHTVKDKQARIGAFLESVGKFEA